MAESGLGELLTLIYGPNTVQKMLSGHAYARAVRGHMLVHEASIHIIFPLIESDDEKQKILHLFYSSSSLTAESINAEPIIRIISEKLDNVLEKLNNRGPTAKLWVQYFRMVTLMKNSLRAERSGNWRLHLQCLCNIIPYFHAAGNFPYAKSAHLYLQSMLKLSTIMPDNEYRQFIEAGYFTVRRTSKFWSGLATDQTIETTLMKSMKSVGSITRDRSTSASVKSQWILRATIGSEVCDQFEKFCEVSMESWRAAC